MLSNLRWHQLWYQMLCHAILSLCVWESALSDGAMIINVRRRAVARDFLMLPRIRHAHQFEIQICVFHAHSKKGKYRQSIFHFQVYICGKCSHEKWWNSKMKNRCEFCLSFYHLMRFTVLRCPHDECQYMIARNGKIQKAINLWVSGSAHFWIVPIGE